MPKGLTLRAAVPAPATHRPKRRTSIRALAVVMAIAGVLTTATASSATPAKPATSDSAGRRTPSGDEQPTAWAPAAQSGVRVEPGTAGTPRVAGTRQAPARMGRAATTDFDVTYTGFTPTAQAAFQHALDLWGAWLAVDVPITVDATWAPLGGGFVAQSGASRLWQFDDPSLGGATLYPDSLANQRSGSDLHSSPDIVLTISSDQNWYFGTDGGGAFDEVDLVMVVLHELAHGLGFGTTAQLTGGSGAFTTVGGTPLALPSIFDRFVIDGVGTNLTTGYTNPSVALGDAFESGELRWEGPGAALANGGSPPQLFAPTTYEPGSSIIHLDETTYPTGATNALMTPTITTGEAVHTPGGIGLGIFSDMGWGIEQHFFDVGPSHPFFAEIEALATTAVLNGFSDGGFHPADAVSRQAFVAFLWRLAGEPAGPFADPGFDDVGPTHPFATPIAWAAAGDLVNGYADGGFHATAPVSRQAAMAVFHRLEASPPGPFPDPGYTDVAETNQFLLAIAWATDAGLATGFVDGTFRPTSPVSRQATAAFLDRYLGLFGPP